MSPNLSARCSFFLRYLMGVIPFPAADLAAQQGSDHLHRGLDRISDDFAEPDFFLETFRLAAEHERARLFSAPGGNRREHTLCVEAVRAAGELGTGEVEIGIEQRERTRRRAGR